MSSSKKNDKNSPFAVLTTLKLPDARAKAPARPAPSPSPKVSPADEARAFQSMMSGVTPLRGKTERVAMTATVPRAIHEVPTPVSTEDDEAALRLAGLASSRFEVVDDGVLAEGRLSDVSAAMMRKLRRGQFPIDGRLDLHGHGAAEANVALVAFIRQMRARGERCVQVIHGKGVHSPGGIGVLRGEMSAWLSQGPAAPSVAAFASQADADGASGAMLVLLRR